MATLSRLYKCDTRPCEPSSLFRLTSHSYMPVLCTLLSSTSKELHCCSAFSRASFSEISFDYSRESSSRKPCTYGTLQKGISASTSQREFSRKISYFVILKRLQDCMWQSTIVLGLKANIIIKKVWYDVACLRNGQVSKRDMRIHSPVFKHFSDIASHV